MSKLSRRINREKKKESYRSFKKRMKGKAHNVSMSQWMKLLKKAKADQKKKKEESEEIEELDWE